MIRFVYDGKDGRTHLGLGISRENVDRLTGGQPIRVTLAEMHPELRISGTISIYFAETDRELHAALAEFIGPETKVKIDPRLKSKLT